jgi:hypothetical protein
MEIHASAAYNFPSSVVSLTQLIKGASGNTAISEAATYTTATSFSGGVNADSTARVYGSEALGIIQKSDYQLAAGGEASKHKHHRNNIEKLQFSGGSEDFFRGTVVTASVYDNAFVSHMIPRTDKQYAWITGSLI